MDNEKNEGGNYMEFGFTDEQQQFRKEVRDFFNSEKVKSKLDEIKLKDEDIDPRELYKVIAEKGYLSIWLDNI